MHSKRRFLQFILVGVTLIVQPFTNAQELRCQVDINTDAIEGTNKRVFETLRESVSDYMNETQWTNTFFMPYEKIDCRLFFTIKEYSNNRIKGDLQVQLSRPVYNSSYITPLLNFKDTKIDFEYYEGEELIHMENMWKDNLTALLDFYAYLFLGIDFDTFSPGGGQEYFNKASSIVQQAQSRGETGWQLYEDNHNRSSVLSSFTDKPTAQIRNFLYDYHRKGLDEMATTPEKGRSAITKSLHMIKDIHDVAPMSVSLEIFRNAKIDELVNIYSEAPQTERDNVYELLMPIYPTDHERLDRIKNPEG